METLINLADFMVRFGIIMIEICSGGLIVLLIHQMIKVVQRYRRVQAWRRERRAKRMARTAATVEAS